MATLKDYALTTVADVKESLGIASSNHSYDNLITRKINQATAAIENYCHRRFKQTAYTDELYNPTRTNQLILKQRPIVESETFSIERRDTSQNLADFDTVDTQLYFVDAESGVVGLNFGAGGNWSQYAVTYTAGYDTIPDDLAEACATLAAFYVSNADGSGAGLTSKQEGSRKTTYSNANQTFETVLQQLGINSIIDSYVNIPIFADK